MSAAATYTLLPLAVRTLTGADVESEAFPTGGRTRWDITIAAPAIADDTTIALQARVAENDTWRTVRTVLLDQDDLNRPTLIELSTAADDFRVEPYDRELRAVLMPLTAGTYTLGVTVEGPFLDTAASSGDLLLLSPALRTYDELDRIVTQAEDDVLNRPLIGRLPNGRLTRLDMSDVRFLPQIKLAIARQAERRFAIDQLVRSQDASMALRAVEIDPVTEEIDDLIGPYIIELLAEEEARESGERWLAMRGRAAASTYDGVPRSLAPLFYAR